MSDYLIPDVAFSDNTNQRTPCVLVLDGSTSMLGPAIDQLNAGLKTLERELKKDPTTALRVQLLIIRVGGYDKAEVVSDWVDAIDFHAPTIEANGTTPLGKAMDLALDKVAEQKARYDANGISSTRPWIMMISDGAPNDHGWQKIAARCRDAERAKQVAIFPIGVEHADFEALDLFSNNRPKHLAGLQFNELFVWLSRSMSSVSTAAPGQQVQLPAADWAVVEV
ncbi:VWA domain-containing protein [Alkalilimnicola ehrlichii]|uniref:VWFA domain-containing protein n=1 Tax=Alkalilimnicola ehrlichii TaxID=351052 RepID=A0A3E0WHD9_9GAMM|nr:VWA domain-containing protein [Alkalilimnicola ehrlichii]RFA31567.1 hypothetical protein CAL65_22250 [Alkalilimnicola ehrlichii]